MKIKHSGNKLEAVELEKHSDVSTASFAVARMRDAIESNPEQFPDLTVDDVTVLTGLEKSIRQDLRGQKQRGFSLAEEKFAPIIESDKEAELLLGAIGWLASTMQEASPDIGQAEINTQVDATTFGVSHWGKETAWQQSNEAWFAANAVDMIDSMPDIEFDTGTIAAIVGDHHQVDTHHK